MAREFPVRPQSIPPKALFRTWAAQEENVSETVSLLIRDVGEASTEGDAGMGYDSPSTAIVTPAAGAWGPLSWNLPGTSGTTPLAYLKNSITEWPTSGPPWSEIRPYRKGVHRVSCSIWGPTNVPPQVWAAGEFELAVFLNGALFRMFGSENIQVAAGVPVQAVVAISGTSLIPIWAPQDPEDPGTPGDIITFQIRTTSGTSQTLVGGEVAVDVDYVGGEDWTDY